MKPSPFLQKRAAAFLKEVAGDETVQYIKFDDSSLDSDLGEITDEVAAYSAQPVPLPALVELQPSRAMREKLGLELNLNAVLTLALEHLNAKNVTVSIGDAFILPGDERKSYVKKIVPMMQVGDQFLSRLIAVGRKMGRR